MESILYHFAKWDLVFLLIKWQQINSGEKLNLTDSVTILKCSNAESNNTLSGKHNYR